MFNTDGKVVFGDDFSIGWSILISLNCEHYTSIKELASDIYGSDDRSNVRKVEAIVSRMIQNGWLIEKKALRFLPSFGDKFGSGIRLRPPHYWLLRDYYDIVLKHNGLRFEENYSTPDNILNIIEESDNDQNGQCCAAQQKPLLLN